MDTVEGSSRSQGRDQIGSKDTARSQKEWIPGFRYPPLSNVILLFVDGQILLPQFTHGCLSLFQCRLSKAFDDQRC